MQKKNFLLSKEDFYTQIMRDVLEGIHNNNYQDNYVDDERTEMRGVFHVHKRIKHFRWFHENLNEIFNAFKLIEDNDSKELYIGIIKWLLGGQTAIKIPVEFPLNSNDFDKACKFKESDIETLGISRGAFDQKLKFYDFDWEGHTYKIDCTGLKFSLQRKQYFYEKVGDTSIVFSNYVGEKGKVYCFEPFQENIKILKHNVRHFPIKNCLVFEHALSDKNQEGSGLIASNNFNASFINDGKLATKKLDHLVYEDQIEKVNFIKLDVEGDEKKVLVGAENSINLFKPKLAISIYHGNKDFYEIINYLNLKHPFYSFHIGHYTLGIAETVLYCLPKL